MAFQATASRRGMASNTARAEAASPARPREAIREVAAARLAKGRAPAAMLCYPCSRATSSMWA